MYGVLNDIRIVEQGTFITGPCAGMMLADLGADVIKIESPEGGDPYRSFKTGLYSAHFQAYNRNKRSVCLDLKSDSDREAFYTLIRQADVFVQNFRPGVAARFGADPDALQSINPRLVYCSISGFGSDGPYAKRPVYDSVAQAMSGFLGVAIDPEQPRFIGPALADAITGIYAALGIAGALVERERTGKGRLIEISMLEAMMHFSVEPFTGYFALGELPTGSDRPRLAQAFIVRCKDGRLFAIHLSSLDKFWDALVDACGATHLTADPRFSLRQRRIDNYQELCVALDAVFAERDRNEWVERFSHFDVPFAPVNSIPDVVEDLQVAHLGMIVPVTDRSEGAKLSVRPPFTFDRQRAVEVRAAPTIDEHGNEVLRELVRNRNAWPARQKPSKESGEPALREE
jgi:crotonobetainyl-CoA:carnitine CoA-transferase CaiB-like acyl-CoA transferase